MARPLRLTYEGAVYHVTIRGNEQRAVFRTNSDRERFVTTLGESVRLYDVRLYLFCLMTNHVHLVLETPLGNLSRFMQRQQTAYA
ncbi:MAG: transposase [Planctomycetes bacterium]|nr:transposase [Planctomycetota bacterium]